MGQFKHIPQSCRSLQSSHIFTRLLSEMEESQSQDQGQGQISCLEGNEAKETLEPENLNSGLQNKSLVATVAILIGFFASGDWKTMDTEMENFKGGKIAYVMNLFWTAVSWQMFNIGCLGLIIKVSSLFSNAISVVGYPLTPVFSVIFLKEKITGVKVISLLLASWGLLSYGYQNYLDDLKRKEESKSSDHEFPQASRTETN